MSARFIPNENDQAALEIMEGIMDEHGVNSNPTETARSYPLATGSFTTNTTFTPASSAFTVPTTIFSSLEQAYAHLQRPPWRPALPRLLKDVVIEDAEQKRGYILRMTDAMMDMSEAQDSPKWPHCYNWLEYGHITAEIEATCWSIVESVIQLHRLMCQGFQIAEPEVFWQTHNLTCEERLEAIISLFKYRKFRCTQAMNGNVKDIILEPFKM